MKSLKLAVLVMALSVLSFSEELVAATGSTPQAQPSGNGRWGQSSRRNKSQRQRDRRYHHHNSGSDHSSGHGRTHN